MILQHPVQCMIYRSIYCFEFWRVRKRFPIAWRQRSGLTSFVLSFIPEVRARPAIQSQAEKSLDNKTYKHELTQWTKLQTNLRVRASNCLRYAKCARLCMLRYMLKVRFRGEELQECFASMAKKGLLEVCQCSWVFSSIMDYASRMKATKSGHT